jgi:fibronectin-binding autotransporter adhesin
MLKQSKKVRAARSRALLGAVALVVLPAAARADDFNWKSSITSGSWSVASDWSDFEHPATLGPPANADNAFIGFGDTVTLNVPNSDINNLYLGYEWGGTGTLENVAGGTLGLSASSFQLTINDDLTVNNGSSVSGSDFGLVVNGEATVGVSGAASNLSLTNGSQMDVGTLNIGESSTVTMNDTSALEMNGSSPALNISGGASLIIEDQSSVNFEQGTLTVDGGGTVALENNSFASGGFLYVGQTSAATVTIDSTSEFSVAGIVIDEGGNITVNGGQLDAAQTELATNGGGYIQVGFQTAGSLNVNSGGEVDCLILGITAGSTVSLNGGSQLKVDPGGNLDFNGGAAVSIDDGSSLILQNGSEIDALSGDIKIGDGSGPGTVILESGSRLFSTEFEIDNGGGSSLLLDGEDTTVSVTTAVAAGALTIQNGATLSDTTGVIAGGATATVSGALSTWASGGSIAVGFSGFGSGTLIVQSGGAVSSGGTVIDDFSGSITITGTGTYGGASSLTVASGLYVGYDAQGTLTVENGGYVSDLNGFIGYLPGSSGTALITDPGTIWNNTQGLYINTGGSLTIQNSATVTAASGSAASGTTIKVKSGGKLAITGVFNNSSAMGVSGVATFGSLTGSGTVMDNGTLIFTPTASGAMTNVVSGTGTLAMSGGGTLVISTSNPSFTGVVNANNGTLQIGTASSLGTSALNISAAATVDLNGNNLSVTSLSGSGAVDDLTAGGVTTLTVANSSADIFYGDLRDTTGSLNLTDAGTGTLSLAGINTYGGTTTINAGAKLALISTDALPVSGPIVNNGTLLVDANTISGPVTGSGTAIVAPGVTFTTDFTQAGLVNNGTTYIDGQSSVGSITGNGNLLVAAGAKVALGPAAANTMQSLTLGTGASIDLNTGSIAINFGSNADPISAIKGYLAGGYNGGSWSGLGINSSVAAAAIAASQTPLLSVGYADGNTDAGTPATAGQIFVRFTLAGDALLVGAVNFNDLDVVGRRLNTSGNDWANGNFNYDPNGAVNFNDLDIIGQNLNKTINDAGVSLGGTTVAIVQSAAVEVTNTSVPEPGTIALAVTCGAGLLARRWRRAVKSIC